MEKNLKFIETKTIEQFKEDKKVSKIDVVRNPRTDKLFFAWGPSRDCYGAVAEKNQDGNFTNPVISKVEGEKTPNNPDGIFYLLHEETQSANVVASF